MYKMQRQLNWLETPSLFIQQKTTETVGLYTHKRLQFQSLEKEMLSQMFIMIQKW